MAKNEMKKVDEAVETPVETGVIKYEPIADWAALNMGGELAKARAANLEEGERLSEGDLIRVKTPSQGGTKWSIPDVSGEVLTDKITGLLVFQCRQGTIWNSDDPSDESPVVITRDMKYGKINWPKEKIRPDMWAELEKCLIPGSADTVYWDKLPYTQFGTGKKGIGKYAKESRPLFILRKDDAYPLLIRCGPGSIKNIKQFIMHLKCEYWRAVIELTLKKEKSAGGIDYSQVIPKLVGTISNEEGEIVRQSYTNFLKESWEAGKVSIDDREESEE